MEAGDKTSSGLPLDALFRQRTFPICCAPLRWCVRLIRRRSFGLPGMASRWNRAHSIVRFAERHMERVRWLGLRRDMPALLDAAEAFVLASAWEGMPLVIGEAMAMEKPVVATDVGGVREMVGDAGAHRSAKKRGGAWPKRCSADANKRMKTPRLGRAARARVCRSHFNSAIRFPRVGSVLPRCCHELVSIRASAISRDTLINEIFRLSGPIWSCGRPGGERDAVE